ncbi:MAG: glucose-1-phosphate thymidylyltransferase, partial [Eudoraea sp.]|nr:glucose-1-phosphate thymidylyltransferase [Eudoraea sp.]
TTYRTKKAFETAVAAMARRGVEFNEVEERMLAHVFELTQEFRNYPN